MGQLQSLELSITTGAISLTLSHEPDVSGDIPISPCQLSIIISFRMNQRVQVSDIGLLIDTDDVRERIEPLFGDFRTPHILDIPGEYKFVFNIPRRYTTGKEHQCLLRVIAAGKPYTDDFEMLF